jgi:FkbH-like protein
MTMDRLHSEMTWLPAAPDDVAQRIKSLDPDAEDLARDVRALVAFGLSQNQLTKLGKVVTKALRVRGTLKSLSDFRLAVLSNGTMDMIAPVLVASAVRHGVGLEVVLPSYAQVAQEALSPDSAVNKAAPHGVLFAIDHRALPIRISPGDRAAAEATVAGVMAFLRTLRDGVKQNSGALCIFQTFVPPVETLFGNLDSALPGTMANLLAAINLQLATECLENGDILFDVAALAQTVGTASWHDQQMWNIGKFPFADAFIPLYADHVGRLLGAVRGKSRKCLILDLDNTVWGGVIGDDGLDGIRIAQGDAIGEGHLSVQRLALDLRRRGIVLAVCSKNTDEVARKPFTDHPEMLLKLGDIAVFQANWNDKATNIKSIAAELELGIDSMVFLDDNPAERGLVRTLLPEVAVPEVTDDAAHYARTLSAAGYFEAIAFSNEDLKRADFYQDNAKRANLMRGVDGVDAYLASLNMTITFQPFDAVGRARIVQLINKSNQFNLTTRRYTDPEIERVETDPAALGLQVRLSDTFGDNGMISVVICRPHAAGEWEIDTWLMSCRVLGRKVEWMVLGEVLRQAKERSIERLVGRYVPTEKNALVVDHYRKLGFENVRQDADGTTHWALDVKSAKIEEAPMTVVSGFS